MSESAVAKAKVGPRMSGPRVIPASAHEPGVEL